MSSCLLSPEECHMSMLQMLTPSSKELDDRIHCKPILPFPKEMTVSPYHSTENKKIPKTIIQYTVIGTL